MEEGWPLPWPFPTLVPTISASSRGGNLAWSITDVAFVEGASQVIDNITTEAAQLREKFGAKLPPVKSVELYLIEGLSEVTIVSNKPAKTMAVIYPPEFFYVLDVGLSCMIGGSVTWTPVGFGDPAFPEKRPVILRSVTGRSQASIIFPKIAGSVIVGLREGASEDEVTRGLTAYGLQEVKVYGFFATATCRPFEEPDICREMEAKFPFVKYAEPNALQRLIDFSPGWIAKRLV
jgi:hypothetical protein